MFIVYRKGQIVTQIMAWGLGREQTLEELETLLITSGAIIPPKRPRAELKDDPDDESDEDSSRVRSKSTWANYSTKNVRNASKDGDSDSDFDL